MSESAIKTKYGNVKTDNHGYYRVTSHKEGNHMKYLHRLIFEEFYQCNLNEEFPEGIHIHHIDGNPLNNEIWNLEPLSPSEHISIHHKNKPRKIIKIRKKFSWNGLRIGEKNPMYGKQHKRATQLKISNIHNSTGFFRVIKMKHHTKQGFLWRYQYYPEGKKSQSHISSTNLLKLKEKVLAKGLEWKIISIENATNTLLNHGYSLEEFLL